MKCNVCGCEVKELDGLFWICLECAVNNEEQIIKQLKSRKARYKTQANKKRMDEQIGWGYEEIKRLKSGHFKK